MTKINKKKQLIIISKLERVSLISINSYYLLVMVTIGWIFLLFHPLLMNHLSEKKIKKSLTHPQHFATPHILLSAFSNISSKVVEREREREARAHPPRQNTGLPFTLL